jgi:hypothetical protein
MMERIIIVRDSIEAEIESKFFLSDLIKLINKKNKIKAEIMIISFFTILPVIEI